MANKFLSTHSCRSSLNAYEPFVDALFHLRPQNTTITINNGNGIAYFSADFSEKFTIHNLSLNEGNVLWTRTVVKTKSELLRNFFSYRFQNLHSLPFIELSQSLIFPINVYIIKLAKLWVCDANEKISAQKLIIEKFLKRENLGETKKF